MTSSELKFEINSLPIHLRKEVEEFVAYIKYKNAADQVKSENQVKKRKFGFAKGKIEMSDDFDAPLEDFKEYM